MPPKRKQDTPEGEIVRRRSERVSAKKVEEAVPPLKKSKSTSSKGGKPTSKSEESTVKDQNEQAEQEEKEIAAGGEATVDEVLDKDTVKPKSKGGLQVGDTIPDITVQDDKEQNVSLHSLVKDHGAIFFFYPRANTPGCTKQACGFRDNYEAFEKAGYVPIGVSADSPKAQANWKAKENFPYTLLADSERAIISAFGAAKGDKIARSHVVVAKGGVVEDVKIQVSPDASYTGALTFVTKK